MTQSANTSSGSLMIVGGGEEKVADNEILREVAKRVGKGRLIVTTVASHQPEGYFEPYEKVFHELGISDVVELSIRERDEAKDEETLKMFDGATGVYFTGGDQLRITGQIGGTPFFQRLQRLYDEGGIIAGTSAGASVMCETMLVSGSSRESHRIGDLHMAPGLGLVRDAIIDQHFAQRGRMGRLLGAVAQNPRVLGIGIDEDTAICVEHEKYFRVLGSGAVYVVDGEEVIHSNIADERKDRALSLYGVKLHVLSRLDEFDLEKRCPYPSPPVKDR
jgi:cyanophycinase